MRIKEDRSLLTFILLSFVTCGIYSIIFLAQIGNDANTMFEGDGESTMNFWLVLLLSMVTCGIFTFVWFYKLGDRMQKNGPRYNLQIDESGSTLLLWVLLGSFIGIGIYVATYYLINNSNKFAVEYNRLAGNQ